MTSRHSAQEKVARSEQRVKAAADHWNAVDLSEIARCVSALDYSVADLGDAFSILNESPATPVSSVRSDIVNLKSAALRLQRLVDASAAFLRLAPGLACDDAALYESGGSICRGSVSSPEMRGITG